jgi:hypothetical protein
VSRECGYICSGHALPDNAVVKQVMRQIESGAYPYLLEHARQHDAGHPQTSFEFELDLIFDGAATAARQQDIASVAILHGLRLGRALRPQTS